MSELTAPTTNRNEQINSENSADFYQPPEKDASAARARTALRLRYEAEAAAIQKRIGSLEEIRSVLGLSQRKICQLLLIDPSAWSRWTRTDKSKSDAPPHIYRSLQWYLALQDKYPAMDPQFWLHTVARDSQTLWASDADTRIKELELQVLRLLEQGDEFQRVLTEERIVNKALRRNATLLRWSILLMFSVAVVGWAIWFWTNQR